jgi:hypothetical protein
MILEENFTGKTTCSVVYCKSSGTGGSPVNLAASRRYGNGMGTTRRRCSAHGEGDRRREERGDSGGPHLFYLKKLK